MDCIFCSIVKGEIPCDKLYEDDRVLAFKDLNPQAPVHFLVIPKIHISSLNELSSENIGLIAHIFEVIPNIMKKGNFSSDYRVINNCGETAGQTVNHIHFHVLSGRDMTWPPG